MASSSSWQLLASQEASRVSSQAKALWDSLRKPLGERFQAEHSQAQADAEQMFGPICESSPPAERLAHSHHMLSCATRLARQVAGVGSTSQGTPQ